jgi:hypothetical protein
MEVSDQHYASGKNAATHWMEGWVGKRNVLDILEKR